MDPNDRWIAIKCAITMMLDKVAPVKTVLLKESIVPWNNCQLVSLAKKRNTAYQRARNFVSGKALRCLT